jgi:hypothetical protein
MEEMVKVRIDWNLVDESGGDIYTLDECGIDEIIEVPKRLVVADFMNDNANEITSYVEGKYGGSLFEYWLMDEKMVEMMDRKRNITKVYDNRLSEVNGWTIGVSISWDDKEVDWFGRYRVADDEVVFIYAPTRNDLLDAIKKEMIKIESNVKGE